MAKNFVQHGKTIEIANTGSVAIRFISKMEKCRTMRQVPIWPGLPGKMLLPVPQL